MIEAMRHLQLGRLSLLVQRHPEVAADVEEVLKEVPADENQDEKAVREAAEERVLVLMREENFGPIGQSYRKVHLAKQLNAQSVAALGRMDFLVDTNSNNKVV